MLTGENSSMPQLRLKFMFNLGYLLNAFPGSYFLSIVKLEDNLLMWDITFKSKSLADLNDIFGFSYLSVFPKRYSGVQLYNASNFSDNTRFKFLLSFSILKGCSGRFPGILQLAFVNNHVPALIFLILNLHYSWITTFSIVLIFCHQYL